MDHLRAEDIILIEFHDDPPLTTVVQSQAHQLIIIPDLKEMPRLPLYVIEDEADNLAGCLTFMLVGA